MRRIALWPHRICAARFFHFSRPRWGTIIPYKLADIGEGIQKVDVVTVFVKPGEKIEEFDKICEVQSDKALVDITSRYAGVIRAVHITVGESTLVGHPLVDIEVDDDVKDDASGAEPQPQEAAAVAEPTATATTPTSSSSSPGKQKIKAVITTPTTTAVKPLATPATRGFARECGVDLEKLSGTGENGRILKTDVLAHTQSHGNDEGDVVVSLLTGIRHVMVSTMTEAGKIPSFTACDEIELTSLLKFREELRRNLTSRSPGDATPKLSLLPLFIKAASLALLQHPQINSHVSQKCETFIIRKAHNIGFAVHSPKGLIVPVIRNVEQKSTMDIVQEVNELVELGRKNRIPPEHMRDGTFTISNVGTIGATYATPMILPPQVAISAFGRLQVLPRFDVDGNVVRANIVHLSSTADHRVIEGAAMVQFNNALKGLLENPQQLIA
ncbi:dihydrolipoamide branched chain transacylase, putative [Trypanosoma cruzi]|uniref:Dihydrolipoamide acetyltransferase component of pyruvate dehydrogenase complex n=1 Tax=Trypanosoma cruzi Dm28c TaxID=1416333 RepID=V5BJF4_TRYCR|nr:dihydrolipoamide branched chain transacylase, putative [Trypanosoma cruzi]ESS64593.1 dihydrolipoamide branched chain transacylase [Trypanosoma cruzi Dm28c]PBJ72414.1 dihydrolipoamide branched chain transacylase [Trypanosoma cruzi cruzi]